MENLNSNEQLDSTVQSNNTQTIDIKNEKPEERTKLVQKFELLGFGSILYGIVYAFCMYRNLHGITSSILVMMTFAYGAFVLKKLGYELGKKHILYGVLGSLLGINLMFTLDGWVLFVDYIAIILVFVSGVFSVVCDNTDWDFTDHIMATVKHVFSSIAEIFDIFADWSSYSDKKEGKNALTKYIVLGIAVSIPLVVVVLLLLSGADAVFGKMTEDLLGDINISTIVGVIVTSVGAILGSYAWIVHFLNEGDYIKHKNKRNGEPVVLIVVGIALGLIYILFCGIQVVYLFAGLGELPKGYTYASYAREGFFQLLAVCLLNLIIVLIGISRFKENIILKVILTVITGCTYIMVASSAYRMYLYVAQYQLSVLRLWVLWTLVWLSLMLTGALINVYKESFSLFRFSMIVTAVLYLMLAYARPAYVVAKYNLSGMYTAQEIDYSYIRYDLNPDAAGVILDYYEKADKDEKDRLVKYFPTYDERIEHPLKLRSFNVSSNKYYSIRVR